MINSVIQEIIKQFVSKTFNSLRLNLLGPAAMEKKHFIFSYKTFDPRTTLASQYLAANSLNSINPESMDSDTVKKIEIVAKHYIDSLEQKSVADINRVIGEKYDNLSLQAKRDGKSIEDMMRSEYGRKILSDIKSELDVQKDRMNKAVDLLANDQLHNAQNVGALDGIIGMSKSLGISDPTVFKIGVLDEKRCKHCWRLWTLRDKVTPRVYKLSELSGSSGDYKNPDASVSPTHPNCRDVLSILMPGFGFTNGKVSYIGQGYDEYNTQNHA